MRLTATMDRLPDRPGIARLLLFVASMAAGLIHAAVISEHVEEAWVFGAFFAVTATFQVVWAFVLLRRPSRGVHVTGALANGAIVGTWLLSRTLGVPVGPEPWTAEPAATADLAASVLEPRLVSGSLILLRARSDRA